METRQQQPCLQPVSKLPLRIIEYIWAHRMEDVLQGWFLTPNFALLGRITLNFVLECVEKLRLKYRKYTYCAGL